MLTKKLIQLNTLHFKSYFMKFLTLLIITAITCAVTSKSAVAQTSPISFENAQCFSVLAATTVTNTGPTFVQSNVGVSPGSSITGFDLPVTIAGTLINGKKYTEVASLAGPAQVSATALYNKLWARTDLQSTSYPDGIPTLGYAGGPTTLQPGIYNFSSAVLTGGDLILDDSADPNAVFIFKIGSTITTADYSTIKMKSGGPGTNVFWVVGSSATIATYSKFCGHVIALTSISIKTGATTTGKLIALNAAVTMDTNKAMDGGCNITVLPITYLSFTAVCDNQKAILSWSTATEINNKSFTVENSLDGLHWATAGVVSAAGSSSTTKYYSFKDQLSTSALTYYRLKQTDFNGIDTYSSTIVLKNCASANASTNATVYPNPSNGKCNLLYAGDRSKVKLIEVFNATGEKVYESLSFQSTLDLSSKLSGMYYIRMHLISSEILHATFVKTR